ncbi:hypothetical protein AMAG_14818 [Allomyces macrogynus ATCC 38327]|uniref:Uncharacterized protein n=1 Tax=Allomyces macrogynus (strain ATCC 38327) TaxID=578462 RepID=A0A0L0T5H4_ALLM3|nr:hypothetical protein AMAG_14818 [Allomyces macrogynus ATCC 38327]|eukprot:KNE69982.1 hypothetical protein AMAG_14818 [Allomyces macrogynus ATCC 38327]
MLAPSPVDLEPTVDAATLEQTVMAPVENGLPIHTAVLKAAKDGDNVDKDALAKLLAVITERTKDIVSHDLVLAHLVLLAAFHQQLRDAENEAKDLAFLCAAEARYLRS